jgi:hypothetical protein
MLGIHIRCTTTRRQLRRAVEKVTSYSFLHQNQIRLCMNGALRKAFSCRRNLVVKDSSFCNDVELERCEIGETGRHEIYQCTLLNKQFTLFTHATRLHRNQFCYVSQSTDSRLSKITIKYASLSPATKSFFVSVAV